MDRRIRFEQITVWCFAMLLFLQCFIALDCPVETKSGKIDGKVFRHKDKEGMAFLGIPFAQPPVGDLRFRKPEPVQQWNHILQATEYSAACHQTYPPNYPWVDYMDNQSEDCLYLNIWVPPNTHEESKKAVMFFIFSGAYSFGSSRLPVYDGSVLSAEGDVIVININYRLGVLGFFSSITEITEAPGNMGLFDVLIALKWVNNNIEAFGGDSDRITVFGHSAGSVISGMLCISPLSKGLFQRAILQSGSPATPFSCGNEGNNEIAPKFANAVGCPGSLGVVECLRSKDPELLVQEGLDFHNSLFTFKTICGDDFLPVDPQVQVRALLLHDVDIMVGNTQDEASFILCNAFNKTLGFFGEKSSRFSKATGMKYAKKLIEIQPAKEAIVHYYFKAVEENDYDAIREQTYHTRGDSIIVCPNMYFAENYAKKEKNVYAYYFNHIPSVTPWASWLGSAHFDEIAFVFGRPLDHRTNYTATDRYLSQKMVKIWSNFAKNGNPGYKSWRKYSREDPYYKVFNPTNRKSYLETRKKNCEFWRSLTGFV